MTTSLARLIGAVLAGLTMTGCTADPTPRAAALPAGRMVFMVNSSGGLVPPVFYALQSPSLVVYGDGRVLTAVSSAAPQLVPVRYELARIDPGRVETFVASVTAGGLISPGTDFGTPRVTDLDTTTVLVDGGSGPAEVRVYALDEQFEANLTEAQRAARADLRTLIGQASALAAGAPAVGYTPDRVVVYEPVSSADEAATASWPGPPPESFMVPSRARRSTSCGELGGDAATTTYRAALDNPGARWLVDGTTRVLAVNSLPLPGACP